MAFNVSSLPDYVEQRRLPPISKTVLGSRTAKYANVQTDVKNKAVVNIVGSTINLGNGGTCGWDETGTTALTQRTITAGNFKVNLSLCDKVLLNKWAGYEVRVAAGDKKLPFEEEIVAEIIGKVSEQADKIVWLGNTTPAASGILSEMKTANSSKVAGTTAMQCVANLLATPAYALIAKSDDLVMFCSHSFYVKYQQELVAANLYHYPADEQGDFIVIPASRVKLIPTAGLDAYDKPVAVLGRASNFVVGCDMVNDNEVFDLWYSKDNREFRLAIEFAIGGQVAFPNEAAFAELGE